MDRTNRAILKLLVEDAKITYDEIADRLGRAKTTVRDRVKKMEKDGIIEGYHAKVNLDKLGYTTSALVFCNLPSDAAAIEKRLLGNPHVREILHITGERRVIVHAVVEDNPGLRRLVHDVLIPAGATDVESRIVMDRVDGGVPTSEPGVAPPVLLRR